MEQPTYLFVHGAFHGAWCWRDVGLEFTARQVPWASVDLPSSAPGADPGTFLADDVHEVVNLANEIGPVILVGHSYGGTVVSDAAALIHDVRAVMYIAALFPEPGQSTTECTRSIAIRTKLDDSLHGQDGIVSIDLAQAGEALAQDCPQGVQDWLVAHLTTQTLASFRSPRTEPDPDVWRRYIMCEFDQAVSPQLQVSLAYRCDETISLASSHSPFVSMPHTLTDALLA
jgi:pimeloyl-ACP methyl ester carboxylesterase